MLVRALALAAALITASSASAQQTMLPAAAVMLGPPPPSAPAPQAGAGRSQVPKAPEGREALSQATISIGQYRDVRGKRTYVSLGSGVVVRRGDVGCVLTARHMFWDPAKGWAPTEVVLRPPPSGNQPDEDGVVVPLVAGQLTLWESPPDGSDLAVLRLPPLPSRSPIYAADQPAGAIVAAQARGIGVGQGGVVELISKARGIVQDCLSGN